MTLNTMRRGNDFSPHFFTLLALTLGTAATVFPDNEPDTPAFPAPVEILVEGKFTFAEGIAFNGEGRLFVTADDAFWEVLPDGNVKRLAGLDSSLGIAPIGERDLLVADFGPTLALRHGPNDDGLVLRITPEGEKTVIAAGIADPNFIVRRRDGYLLVSDDFTRNIWLVSPQGAVTHYTDAVPHPNGLVLADDENTLYVAQIFKGIDPVACDDRVWRIPLRDGKPAGEPQVAFATGGVGCNDGLSMDSRGRIYVAANREGRIWRFDPKGDSPATVIAEQDAASIAFGTGKFDHQAIYLAELRGGRILKVPVGVTGAPLHR